jgi:ectoine hydroxylase-related dioxygenase (phytanoyl-CoA dioxygenase family)
MTITSPLTPDLVRQFHEDGVIHVPQALHPEWLELIEMGLRRVMGDAGHVKHRFYDDQPGEFIETVRNIDAAWEIRRLVFDSPIADLIGAVIGSEEIWYYSDEFFVKDGPRCGRTPWHQDLPYWPMAGSKIASCWVSLDPLPRQDCLEYVRGSHRQTLYDGFNPRRVNEDPTLPFYGTGEFPPLPDIEADRDAWDIVAWDITPGDVILAHPAVLHGGGATSAAGRRRAITVRCFGDDIVYATRPASKPTVPRAPGVSLALRTGDPLRSPWYPQLRPTPPWERG